MYSRLKTYFYLHRPRMNKDGLCPIVCRIAYGEHNRQDFRTRLFIKPDQWDATLNFPTPENESIYERLRIMQDKLLGIIMECERQGIHSPTEVRGRLEEFYKPELTTIKEIANHYMRVVNPPQSTQLRISHTVQRFIEFLPFTQIRLVTPEHIKGYEYHILNEKKFNHSTLKKEIENLKNIFTYARHMNLIAINHFAIHKTKRAPVAMPVQLTGKQVRQLEKYHFSSDRLNKVKDCFLFECYTGLAYIDVTRFGKGNVVLENSTLFIRGERAKTGETYFVPLIEECQTILEHYDYKLPILSNQKYNAYLKEIADILGFKVNLTTHVARRTFAQLMIDKGYTPEAITKMMAHKNFAITQKHYARIGETRVMNEFEKINDAEVAQLTNLYDWKAVTA
jgi:integrase/recombinase XerD